MTQINLRSVAARALAVAGGERGRWGKQEPQREDSDVSECPAGPARGRGSLLFSRKVATAGPACEATRYRVVTSLGPSIAGFNFPAIDLVAATILSLSYIIKVNLREGGS